MKGTGDKTIGPSCKVNKCKETRGDKMYCFVGLDRTLKLADNKRN